MTEQVISGEEPTDFPHIESNISFDLKSWLNGEESSDSAILDKSMIPANPVMVMEDVTAQIDDSPDSSKDMSKIEVVEVHEIKEKGESLISLAMTHEGREAVDDPLHRDASSQQGVAGTKVDAVRIDEPVLKENRNSIGTTLLFARNGIVGFLLGFQPWDHRLSRGQ